MMPQLDDGHRLHNDERRQADALPHRRLDLETAVATLQWGPLAPRVQEILDRHRSELPPEEERDHDCQVWQLALHRMDVRRYRVVRKEPVPPPTGTDNAPEAVRQVRVEVEIDIPEPPVQEMVRQGAAEQAVTNARLGLLMWGLKVFRREDPRQFDPGQWRECLSAARVASTAPSPEEQPLGEGGAGFVAAVCVRDYWAEMTGEERRWCAAVICAEIERESDNWHCLARCQVGGMSADRPAAWVISALVGRPLEGALRDRVQNAFVLALTHATDEVRNFAAAGIGANLWTTDRDRTIRSVNALATEAALQEEAFATLMRGASRPRRQPEEMASEIAATVRRRFAEPGGIPANAYQTVDTAGWFGSDALLRMLAIAGNAPTEVAIALFERLATTLVAWWDADEESRHERHRRERPTRSEPHLTTQYVQFLLRAEPATAAVILAPILGAIDRHAREVTWVVRGLIEAECRQRTPARFWALWRLLAEGVRNSEWLPGIDEEHADGEELLSALFFGLRWNDGVRHWSSLEGHAEQVHALFEALPASRRVFEDYVRFLYSIGEQSLPSAFIRLARCLDAGGPARLLSGRNTVYMLEVLLQRHVYARPLELKQRTDLRLAVLRLLDLLVECGSSAAFRMRDDFVTPVSTG
jgi:hypothetical protein